MSYRAAEWLLVIVTLLALVVVLLGACSTEHVVSVEICVPLDSLRWSDSTVVFYPRECAP